MFQQERRGLAAVVVRVVVVVVGVGVGVLVVSYTATQPVHTNSE
jgi:hypothetical protein